jgi:hypothetical protein
MSAHAVHGGAPNLSIIGGTWDWSKPRGPEHFRRCNYCGSIHPEDLVAETNWTVEWSDQKYGWPHKFYVDIPDRNGELDYLGSANHDMGDEELARYGWKRVGDLTHKERKALKRVGVDLKADHIVVVGVGPRATHHAKFYTEHLADPNIPAEVKDEIHRRSGLIFEWLEDGRVSWRRYE